jgi:hypothetical protein
LKKNDHHDNYKEIRKDVQRINEMVKNAEDLGIELDEGLKQNV